VTEGVPVPAPDTPARGCLKTGVIGCGSAILAVLLLLSVAGLVVSSNPARLRAVLAGAFDVFEGSILSHCDASVTEADREEFGRAYSRFRAAWLAGRIDSRSTEEFRKRMVDELQRDRFKKEDLRSLARFLDGLAPRSEVPASRRRGTVAA
jgi:hypothetical protein